MTIQNPKAKEEWEVSGIGTGEYLVKATSNSGAVKYRVVYVDNVTDRLTPPILILNPASPNGENDWYKTEVQVSLTTESPSAKEIRYMLIENGISDDPDEGIKYEGTITIRTNGTVTIKAWTTDGTYRSDPERAQATMQIDTGNPSITNPAKIEPTIANKPPVNGWYKTGVNITIGGTDATSGIAGYKYMIKGEDTNWKKKKLTEKLSIGDNEREGITEIVVKTYDYAGRESNQITINIPKDTKAPTFTSTEPSITNIKPKSMTISTRAIDPEPSSGVNGNPITYKCYITEVGTTNRIEVGAGQTNTTGIFQVAGLKPNKTYDIDITAKDYAGNEASQGGRASTNGTLSAPVLRISPTSPNGTGSWYKGTEAVTITVTDPTTPADQSLTAKIKYIKNGKETQINGKTYTDNITANGTYTIEAYALDENGKQSAKSNVITFKKDGTAPAPTLSGTSAGTTTITTTASANESGGSGIAHYKFEYKEGNGAWQVGTQGNDTGTTKKVTFNVPKDNTNYKIRVTVTDGAGNTGTSTEATIKTQVANTPPYNLTTWCSSKTTTSMTIQARAYDNDTPAQTLTYKLYWGNSNTAMDTKTGTSGNTVTFTTKTGLAEYTTQTYSWKVEVTDSNNSGIFIFGEGRTFCSGKDEKESRF